MNPNWRDNLKPFEKGNKAGVGHGRPKGKSLTTRFQEAMEIPISLKNKNTGDIETKETAEWFIADGIKRALSGDFRYWKEIKDTIDGKPLQKIEAHQHIQEVEPKMLTDEQLDRFIETMRAEQK